MTDAVVCSKCFLDQGLRLDSFRIGSDDNSPCVNCGFTDGRKLSKELVSELAHRFFVEGTMHRSRFGGAPVIVSNAYQRSSITPAPWFESDLRLLERVLSIGFFHYGPRLWMLGEIEPLKELLREEGRKAVTTRIITEYPSKVLSVGESFYRVRRDPTDPASFAEYDSPPINLVGRGRLDSMECPVLYGSQDIQVCIQECRVTVEDNLYIATLAANRDLNLLDLTEVLAENVTEFESLDIAVHMLFLAGSHAYEVSRAIALAAYEAGYDGVIYPSFFSLIRTGFRPFDTVYGISIRKIPQMSSLVMAQTISNVAIFGKPIEQGLLTVQCVNRLILNRVEYDVLFGPVGYM